MGFPAFGGRPVFGRLLAGVPASLAPASGGERSELIFGKFIKEEEARHA